MPIITDFMMAMYEDGILTIAMAPPTPIGGWSLRFEAVGHYGSTSGLIVKSCSSGSYGVSGINILNSGQGIFSVHLNSQDTSGLDFLNYPYSVERMDSGYRTVLAEGCLLITPPGTL